MVFLRLYSLSAFAAESAVSGEDDTEKRICDSSGRRGGGLLSSTASKAEHEQEQVDEV